MLKVSLHYATPTTVSAVNVLGRVDIAYATLDARADYKAVMSMAGIGEQAPIRIEGYPRWSGSVWDLVARVICQTFNKREAIWPTELPFERKCAFIDDLTAVIEHWPDGLDTRRATIGTAHVRRGRRKGHYTARFDTDLQGAEESSVFLHTPLGLNPWDLLARAYAWTVNERFELPPRPTLYTPIPVQQGGESLVPLETVREPARTGLLRWLHRRGMAPLSVDGITGACVTEAHFVEFLRKVV